MAGHMIASYLQEQGHTIDGFSRRPCSLFKTINGDARDFELLKRVISQGHYSYIINCIGILNQFAERNQADAVLINSYLPHFLKKVTMQMETRIIHLSTDCIFSGNKGEYKEQDYPDGTSFYDRTKALGELNDDKNLTFRNSIVGPDLNRNGIGLFNWFMQQQKEISGYTKAIWTGVTTLTLAHAIEKAAMENLTGVYHLVGKQSINKYRLLTLFNQYCRKKPIKIISVDGLVLDKSLVNTRTDFSFGVPTYSTMVEQMSLWIACHADLYSHYEIK